MSRYKKLSHVIYYHNYHIVWTPKYRYRKLEGVLKDLLDKDIRMLCEWKGAEVLELSIQHDHVHMVVSVPPRVSISELMGFFVLTDNLLEESGLLHVKHMAWEFGNLLQIHNNQHNP